MDNTTKQTKYIKEYVIATLFLVFISVAYLICSPKGVDIDFHMLRIGELGKELGRISSFKDFPVYIYRDVYYHYGYPIPIFYCALFLYPFAGLVCLGMSPLWAYKIMVLSLLWGSFFLCKACALYWFHDRRTAYRVAFIYAAQPYFLMDLFVKASIGEAFAFVFIPLVALGYMLISRGSDRQGYYKKGVIFLAIGVNFVICSHVISTILTVIALGILFILDIIKSNNRMTILKGCIIAAVLCFLLSLWYLLPMLEQFMNYDFHAQVITPLSKSPQNFISLIFLPMHASIALSTIIGREVPLSEIGGAPLIMVLTIAIIIAKRKSYKIDQTDKKLLVIYVLLVISMCIGVVWVPFEKILGFMQFTWRVYFIAALVGIVFIIRMLIKNSDGAYFSRVMFVTIFSSLYVLFTCFGYFFVRDTLPKFTGGEIPGLAYSSETTDILYIPQNIDPYSISERKRVVSADSDEIDYTYDCDEKNGTVTIDITTNANKEDVSLEIPFIMYNGYTAVNIATGQKYKLAASDSGYVKMSVPGGTSGKIAIRYERTIIQYLSYVVSVASLICLLVVGIINKRHYDI
ncbi:hypothetical protein [Butyrivibrio proteoclasticus]|uniref:hypothetical protein n=1 Tax=Butyrivibrio proteoclasticus TaxID=43305 RepID=UPI00047EEB1E|nr:hypothetical protein [Butyrivibrio proteoclasticus]